MVFIFFAKKCAKISIFVRGCSSGNVDVSAFRVFVERTVFNIFLFTDKQRTQTVFRQTRLEIFHIIESNNDIYPNIKIQFKHEYL